MYSLFTRIHWLQLVASVAGKVGGGSRCILSRAHLILAPIVEETGFHPFVMAGASCLPMMPWEVGGSEVEEGELDVVGSILRGRMEFNTMAPLGFDLSSHAASALQVVQSEEHEDLCKESFFQDVDDKHGIQAWKVMTASQMTMFK